jgi:iron complex outermembrane receptor protein
MSVAAFSALDLELRGIQRIEDLSVMVPNLQITGQPLGGETGGNFSIRGIPGVRRYVDGAWIPFGTGSITQQIVEVERIEVLRGPQGTLFGKDATGGAIQIFTQQPAEEFGARVTATLGNYDRRDLIVALDAPLSDTVKTKWTLASLERDGYIDSLNVDRSYGSIDNKIFRGDILWTPSDQFELRFSAEVNDYSSNGQARVMAGIQEFPSRPFPAAQVYTLAGLPFVNQTHTAGWPGGEVGERQTKSDYTQEAWALETNRYVLDMEWAISEQLTLKSISAYTEQDSESFFDFCACEYDLSTGLNVNQSEIFSQELQLYGEHDRVSWVAGAYYSTGESTSRNMNWIFIDLANDPSLVAAVRQTIPFFRVPPQSDGTGGSFENETYALFGEATIRVTDPLSLVLGLRWFEEEGERYSVRWSTPVATNPGDLPAEPVLGHTVTQTRPTSFDKVTPRVALRYAWNDNIMGYASYAEGFNSGGTNAPLRNSTDLIPFDPETIKTVEFGLRSDWWGGSLRLNVTAFFTKWDDIQVNELTFDAQATPLGNLTTNAGGAEAEGVEVELSVLLSKNWRFDLGLGLLDTRYTEVGTATSISLDSPFHLAPETSFTIGLQNDLPLSNGGSLTSRLDYGWLDDYVRASDANSPIFEEGYGLLNGRVSYLAPEGNYRLSLFGTNLTDEHYLNSGFIGGFGIQLATVGRPRELGLSLQYFFD